MPKRLSFKHFIENENSNYNKVYNNRKTWKDMFKFVYI